MRRVCGIQGTWPRASAAPPSPPIPSLSPFFLPPTFPLHLAQVTLQAPSLSTLLSFSGGSLGCFAAASTSVDVEKVCLCTSVLCCTHCAGHTGVCHSAVGPQQLGSSCNHARLSHTGYCDWVGWGEEAAVFQPLIPQNYSSDQAWAALHGCRGHTSQPWGQAANYRPQCSLSTHTSVPIHPVFYIYLYINIYRSRYT